MKFAKKKRKILKNGGNMLYPKGGIAFFDSGIGGLTTLSACVEYAKKKNLTPINYFYYGDNFRAPYGNLPEKQIFSYVEEIFSRFQALDVSAVILACNTVTAVCVEKLREEYSFPIIGIEPAILPAMRDGGEVFVLATCATCNSQKFQKLCRRAQALYPSAKLQVFPCEGLAGEIEKNFGNKNVDYSKFLPRGNPSIVVLGCTHYIYIRKEIEAFFGCPAIDGNRAVAKRLFDVLSSSEQWSSVVKNTLIENAQKLPKNFQNFSKIEEKHFSGKEDQRQTSFSNLKERLSKVENREGKPLFLEIFSSTTLSQPLITPKNTLSQPPNYLTQPSRIFFLGDAKMVNKTKYEQMFAKK